MLDTNVLSELGKPDINESVDAWSRRNENALCNHGGKFFCLFLQIF